jgi:hypothetical protein
VSEFLSQINFLKMFFAVKLFATLLALTVVSAQPEYCDKSLCPKGNHIACGHIGAFSPSCPPDRRMVALRSADRNLILDVHNSQRNRIAGGGEFGFESAANMNEIVSKM